MEIMVANGQMGVFGLVGNGVFLANFPSNPSLVRGFSFSQKPILGSTLNFAVIRKSRVFDVRTPQCRTVNALASGEIEAFSANIQSLEKELKFSRTFDEYVKVMESVKTDRSKNLNVDENGCRLKERSTGKDAARSANNRGKGKLRKLKRQPRKAEDNEHEERKKGEEVWLSKEKIRDGGKNTESKDVERLVKHRKSHIVESNRSGWDMVEELQEKRTIRRTSERNFGTSDCNGSNGGSKDDGKSNLSMKYDGVGQTVNNGYSEKKTVSHLRNNSKRWNDQSENERNAGRIQELIVSNQTKVSGSEITKFECINRSTKVLQRDKLLELNKTSAKEYASRVRRGMGDTKMDKVQSKQTKRGQVARKIAESDIDYDGQSIHDMDENHSDNRMHTAKRIAYGSFKNVHSQDRYQSHVKYHADAAEAKNVGSRAIEMLGNKGEESAKIAGRDIHDMDIEDRAAFKTFEVFTDVNNRPRVLRMEMEDRIQKLAKWLNAADINMPEWQFSKMIHGAKIKFTDHSILRVVQILGALGNWKRVLQVVEWLQSRERFKSYKSRYIYTTVLDVLGKAKRPFEALNIFYAMRQELSSYPDVAAYHCIAVILGQAGLLKELFDVIDCMQATPEKKFNLGPLQKWDPRLEPDLVVYNAVLNACVQQKQWEGAFWVLQQLKQQNIKPSNTTYGLIMEVMLACGKYNLVHEFFRKVEKTSIPGALNYRVLVNTLWREEKIDEAVQAVKDMEGRGIVGSAGLYYDLARCLCSAGRCQEALLQIGKICKVAKKPLVVTYTGLIQACLDSGSIENATYIFNRMHKFCSPNIVTCNIMLKSYIEHGKFDEAKDLFYKMLDSSHQIFSRSDTSQVVPDKFAFNIMMEACAEAKKWDDFENAYQEMLLHGYHFDRKRHLRMVLDAFRAGKGRVLELTWAHLVHFGRPPPPPIIKERFCMKLEDEEPRAAISCIGVGQETEMHAFSENSWLNLLWSNANRFKTDTVFRLVEELRDFLAGTDRAQPVYQNLLNACVRFVPQVTNSVNQPNDQQTFSGIS